MATRLGSSGCDKFVGWRCARGLGSSGAISLAVLVVWPSVTDAGASATVLRGQSSQNQPLILKLDRRSHELRVRLPYILRCRVASNGGPPFIKTPLLRSFGRTRAFRVSRSGAVAGTFRFREHRHPNEGYGLVDRRALKVVRFSGTMSGAHPEGQLRVMVTAHEIRTDSEVASPLRLRIRCDTGVIDWRVPRLSFAGPWRPTGAVLVPRFAGRSPRCAHLACGRR